MGVKKVELFENIRQDYFNHRKSIREIAKRYGVHRRQVRQAIANAIPPSRKISNRTGKVLTIELQETINQWLEADLKAPRKQRHTGQRIYERLVTERAYQGSAVTVRGYVYKRRKETGLHTTVYVPQIYAPGEEAEVDWYEAMVDFPHGREKVFIFQMRACYSGREFHQAFLHQNQQAFLEGHIAAFNYFGGVFKAIRYDNLTSAVKKVLRGRKRIETDNFIAMRSHYLFNAVFCMPGLQGAHEKGGVEGGGGRFRRAHFVPVPQTQGLEELNRSLYQACQQDDRRTIIGKSQPIIADWELEKDQLIPLISEAFAAVEIVAATVNHKSMITVRGNHYSVPVSYAGQRVEVQVSADVIVVIKQEKIIAKHRRCYGHHQVVTDLVHYLPLLKYKPGALPGSIPLHQARNKWSAVIEQYWQALISRYGQPDANRQMIDLLWWARDFEAEYIEKIIAMAMELGCYQFESIQALTRQQNTFDVPAMPLDTKCLGDLTCYERPVVNIEHYDSLLTGGRS
jgi:transposase